MPKGDIRNAVITLISYSNQRAASKPDEQKILTCSSPLPLEYASGIFVLGGRMVCKHGNKYRSSGKKPRQA